MPLFSQLFSQIISGAPQLNPGAANWDALVNGALNNLRGKHGFGLLGRLVNVDPLNPTVLFSVPVGWKAMPIVIMVQRIDTTPNATYQFFVESLSGGNYWAKDITMNNLLVNGSPLLIFPWPEANAFNLQAPQDVPMVDGDIAARNSLKVDRGTGIVANLNFFVYGFSWQTND